MKTITKAQQAKLHKQYEFWRQGNNTPEDCIKYALADLEMPKDFDINQYIVIEDKDE